MFGAVCTLAIALRVVVVFGYPGILWFPDSRSYVRSAVDPLPGLARPQGYGLFLHLLEPLHSLTFVAVLQHLFGLAMGVLIYAVLRHRFGLPGWGAALATVPVLFDVYQVQLEHLLLSDTLFGFLILTAVVGLLWRPHSALVCGVAGGLLGLATITRSAGLPLLVIAVGYLLLRRVGWRRLLAAVAVGVIPVAGYAMWFHATWGEYGLARSSGVFLYARTTTFVDCGRLALPKSEKPLCPPEPLGERRPSPDYVWHAGPIGHEATYEEMFTPRNNRLTKDFARRAILAQPLDYLATGLHEFGWTFGWHRLGYPSEYGARHYLFPDRAHVTYPGVRSDVPYVALDAGKSTLDAVRDYDHSNGRTGVVEPLAGFLRGYQKFGYLPGALFGVILAVGLLAIAPRWRRLGGPAMLPWVVSAMLIVVPPFTVSFGYRYILPAVPLACLAAAIAVHRLVRDRRAARSPR